MADDRMIIGGSNNSLQVDDRMIHNLPSSTGGESALSSAMPYAGAISSILGTMGSVSSMKSQSRANIDNINAKKDAMIKTIGSMGTSLKYSQAIKAQQLDDLETALSDKLTTTGLEALKAEARLKAASAETGGIGGSNNDAIAMADVNRLHQDAAILRAADVAKVNTLNSMVAERLNFKNDLTSLTSGQFNGTTGVSTFGALAGGVNTALAGFTAGLNLMTPSQKEDFYGINTTGESNG